MSKPLDRKPSIPFKKVLQMVAQGMVSPDLVSTVAARLARLQRETTKEQQAEIREQAEGKSLAEMISELFTSLDPDVNAAKARERFQLAEDEEPTEEQLQEAERESMVEALRPLYDPKLRETIRTIKASLEQVIDEITQDRLRQVGFDAAAKEKAESLLEDFQRFIEDNKDEIEALQILYSKPYRAGLRYEHVKELAEALKRPPLSIREPALQLWKAYEAVEPSRVNGKGGTSLVDLVALVKHAITPEEPLVPVRRIVEQRYQEWLVEQEAAGITFSPVQQKWLDAIKDHIANILRIEQEQLEYAPFSQLGGLGKAYDLFGDRIVTILEDMNERLAA